MTRYGAFANNLRTPQTEQATAVQVMNNAGGFVFEAGPWKQLDRFLILGQCGATYYAGERKIVKENADVIRRCLLEDGPRVVRRIVEISDAGRAPKNDPAIFALAMAAGATDPATRKAALDALPKVCRIGTHLFHFAADVGGFRRWGRGLRSAVARWYTERREEDLALQAVKYQQRDGWSHRDLLRLAHPRAKTPGMDATFRWMVGGADAIGVERKRGKPLSLESLPSLILAFEAVRASKTAKEVIELIRQHRLPREAVPTEWLNDPAVWEALLPHMGITAMIRNLGKMTALGLLKPMGSATKHVVATLTSEETLRRGRVHPMQFLLAQGIYRQGRGDKGKLSWSPVREIGDALDAGFYTAFKSVQPTGKNTLIALDVSGSMHSGEIAGAPGIAPNIAAAAMAMVTARAEKNWHMVGFTSAGGSRAYGGMWGGQSGLTPIDVSPNDRLDTVCKKVDALPMGGTDCALPMVYAAQQGLEVDVFQIYTDNETWHGKLHPFQALKAYRQKSGRNAKLVVVGLTATNFTIADPSDAGMLDVVGMDAHAPALMADFARGEV
jgi:60 kDa SS-A/Ro ribonucleoprotein